MFWIAILKRRQHWDGEVALWVKCLSIKKFLQWTGLLQRIINLFHNGLSLACKQTYELMIGKRKGSCTWKVFCEDLNCTLPRTCTLSFVSSAQWLLTAIALAKLWTVLFGQILWQSSLLQKNLSITLWQIDLPNLKQKMKQATKVSTQFLWFVFHSFLQQQYNKHYHDQNQCCQNKAYDAEVPESSHDRCSDASFMAANRYSIAGALTWGGSFGIFLGGYLSR